MASNVRLKNLVYRYTEDVKRLNRFENDPEYQNIHAGLGDLLRKRIERHKNDIVNYVTSENFSFSLNAFNL